MTRAFTVINAPQRSDEWFSARLGRLTGSRAEDIVKEGRTKGTESVGRRDLRIQLACERIVGTSQDNEFKKPDWMDRGVEMEPVAFAAYEAATGEIVQRSGFLSSTAHQAGCSLDGHIGDFEGILEVKCPKSATHLRYLRGGIVPADYLPQIIHNLWISGAAWCDFVSFDDRFPEALRLFRVRVLRDEPLIAAYETKALLFLAEVDAETAAVSSKMLVEAMMEAGVTLGGRAAKA